MSEVPAHVSARLDGLEVLVRSLSTELEQLRAPQGGIDIAGPSSPTDGDQVFDTALDWAVEFLLPTFVRPVGGQIRWCEQWADHPEAVLRVKALWQAWEAMRWQSGTGMSEYLLHHLDPGLAALTAVTGPFARCTPDRHVPTARDQPSHTALGF